MEEKRGSVCVCDSIYNDVMRFGKEKYFFSSLYFLFGYWESAGESFFIYFFQNFCYQLYIYFLIMQEIFVVFLLVS